MADRSRTGLDLDLARHLSSMLLRGEVFRESLPVQASGCKVLLVASLDEPLESLLRRVADAGLPATVCVRNDMDRVSMIGLEAPVKSDAEIFVSRPDAMVGILVALLEEKRTLHVRVDGCDVPHVGDVDVALV